ncbi:krab and zinc finger domain-containing [Holotrichia oblita]|uniref:Krab and zinc finger domain-containing n=1 Tax=Holotrichia oblita TaxID=644536 RepID=A0ACB9T1D9_HOLOL|nr:krab and zinc finger domain-containing [Holotrichia oblita]
METEVQENQQELCRTCLRIRDKYFNIFEYSENNKSIPDLLLEYVTIKVERDDGLPRNICNTCLNKLYAAIAFKNMAIECDIRLRKQDSHNNEEQNLHIKLEDITIDMDECPESKEAPLINDNCDDKLELCVANSSDTDQNNSENVDSNHVDDDLEESLLKSDDIHTDLGGETGKGDTNSDAKKMYLTKKDRNSKVVYCEECKRSFGYRYYFEVHARNHIGDTPLKCDVCGKGFVRQFLLNIHKVKHSNDRPFSCEICKKKFKTNISLQNHQSVHTDEKPFSCKLCDKSFKVCNSLRLHELRHNNIKSFICDICGKAFIDRAGLASHSVTHKTEPDVPCPDCGKMFRHEVKMKNHRKMIHSGKRPYVCDYCGKDFRCKQVLVSHVRIHTGEKPFTCKICSKSFRQRTILTLHMRTHTGESPYHCKNYQLYVLNTNRKYTKIMAMENQGQEIQTVICRTCLQMRDKYFDIFEHSENNISIPNLLLENITIKVEKDDGFPQNICNNCLNKLYAVVAFKNMAVECDNRLRKHKEQENTNIPIKLEDLTDDLEECVDSKEVSLIMQKKDMTIEDYDEKPHVMSSDSDENNTKAEYNLSDDSNHVDDVKSDDNHLNLDGGGGKDVINPDAKKVYLTKKERNSKVVYCKECKRTFGYRYYFEVHARNHIGDTPFKCDVCGKGFVRRFLLNIHKVRHSDDRPFSCEICKKRFKTNPSLQNHQTVHTDEKPFSCKLCDKSFKGLNNLKLHELRHDNIKDFVCDICGKAFIDKAGLSSHSVTHKTDPDVPCPECGKMFRHEVKMKNHRKMMHSGKRPYVCDYCGRDFRCKQVLVNHVRIHTGEKPFTCKICSKSFRQRTVLNLHMRTHTGESPYHCKLCPKCAALNVEINDGLPQNICCACMTKLTVASRFKIMANDSDVMLRKIVKNATLGNKISLNDLEVPKKEVDYLWCKSEGGDFMQDKHANVNSVLDDKENVSDYVFPKNETTEDKQEDISSINIEFNEEENADSPLIGDDNNSPVSPDIKENSSEEEEEEVEAKISISPKRKCALSKKEQDQKTLLCKYCNKLFSFRYYFDIHVHQHTGNTPYKCEVCDKRFAKRSMLNKHKQIHSDMKPYQCNVCGKRFKYLSNIHNHKVIHSEQKPYKCDICNKEFKVPGSLRIHIRRHTGDRPYICEICGKSFIFKGDLGTHVETHNKTKNFICPKCGKSFANKTSLKVHLKRHANYKPYTCDRCNKSFSTNTILQHHILIHTGEKPFACNICGKAFRQAACLPRHMRIHTGETPYPCEKCPSKFKYKHHLLNHMKTHS